MPKGVYEHKPHERITKAQLMEYGRFVFRSDIAEQLAEVKQPHLLAVRLYERETGIKINPKTAYAQKGKWIEVAGEICRKAEK